MAVKFKYPSKPSGVVEKDWNSLPQSETVPSSTSAKSETPQPDLTSDPKPPQETPVTKGFQRLVDFIRIHAKPEKKADLQKRRKAIETYKKIKSAS